MPKEYLRTQGEKIALSIGTAIALEESVMVEKLPIDSLWINVRTLFRNYHDSYEEPERVPHELMMMGFANELNELSLLLESMVNLTLYQTNNKALAKRFPHALIKAPTTDKQKRYANIERLSLAGLLSNGVMVRGIQQKLEGDNAKAWVMTSFPLDLMSRYTFNSLELLSSHTGIVKPPSTWIQYLTKNASYHRLPFSLLTLQLLGDRSKQFKAYSGSKKKPLLELAEANFWTPATTRSKMLFDLKKLKDKDMLKLYFSMLTTTLK